MNKIVNMKRIGNVTLVKDEEKNLTVKDENNDTVTEVEPVTNTEMDEDIIITDDMMYNPQFVGYPIEQLQKAVYTNCLEGINTFADDCTILDVGCGRGDLYSIATLGNSQLKYVGIDSNPLMIEIGNKLYGANENFTILESNFNTDNIDDNSYDWIFHISTLTANSLFNVNPETGEAFPDQYEMLKFIVEKSLRASKFGAVFNLLNEHLKLYDETVETNNYITYDLQRVADVLQDLGIKYKIECVIAPYMFKLITLKN